ncbi:beta strand repeat-containing protein [Polynucleobacter necessarius]|uniref:beta strand repeat-containing protein n=1 Tax=Polynucleobacter necessarius TaxID=576610 RepID=UPI000E095A4D|nr:hypothetical protein [Polynucleobacter necessarius]
MIGLGSSITSTSCGGAACSLALDDVELGRLADGFTSITIGSTSGTGAIAINYTTPYTFLDPVTIQSKSTSGGGSITATSTLASGANNMAISTYGAVSVAAITSAGTLAITGNGITLNGNITTSSTQAYTGAVTLATGDIELTGTSATFSTTVTGGANALAITGNAVFNGSLSNVTDLSVSGTAAINASSMSTTGSQSCTGAVTASVATTITASALTTGSTLAVSANNLTLLVDAITLGGNLSGTGALVIVPKTLNRDIYLGSADNSASAVLNLKSTDIDYLVDGFSSILIGGAGYSGSIASQGNTSFKDPTTFTSSFAFTLSHNLLATASTNASFTVGGSFTWNGGDITTGTGVVTLSGDMTLGGSGTRTLSTTSGIVTIGASTANTVTGNAASLTLNSGSAATNVYSTITGVNVLGLGTSGQSGTITLNGAFTTTSIATGAAAYSLVFNGGDSGISTVTDAATFANTSALTLGNQAGDIFVFTSGLTATAQSTVNLAGAIRTAGTALSIGNGSTTTYLSADTVIDTTNNGANSAGGAIALAGSVVNVNGTSAALASGWTNGTAYSLGVWGSVIGIYGQGGEISRTFTLGGASTTLNFNFYRLDLWDGERFQIYANGVLIVNQQFFCSELGSQYFLSPPITGTSNGYSWTITPVAGDSNLNMVAQSWTDQRFTVALTTPSGLASVPLRFTSTLDQGNTDESWAVSGFSSAITSNAGLTLNSGAAAISASTNLGSTGSLNYLTVTNSGGATFSGSVSVANASTVSNTASAATVAFTGGLTTGSLVTTANPYNVSIVGGSNTITSAATFLNTGSLTLGNLSSSAITFSAGLTATAPTTVNLAGTITSNGPVTIGTSSTGIALTAATTINTSGGSSAANRALTLAAPLTGDNIALTLTSGTGVITTAAMGTSGHGLGALIFNGDEFNPTADVYGQSTLVVKPYTSGNTMVIGGENNNSDTVLNLTATEIAYLKDGFTGITIGSSTTGQITVSAELNVVDPLVIDTNGANISVGADMRASDNGTFTFNDPAVISGNVTMITADQALSFSSNLNGTTAGAENLILNTGNANITFNGLVGNVTPLNVISLDSSGTITINQPVTSNSILTGTGGTTVIDTPTISTVGTQSFNNAVLIKRNTIFSTTNSNITFNGTVNSYDNASARTVGIDAGTAAVAINGVVGGTNVLGATIITGASFSIGLNGSIAMGANAISITTDAISLAGAISGTSTLTIAPRTVTTTIGLGTTATGSLHFTDTELSKLSDGFSSITFGSPTATGKITAAEYTYLDHIKLLNYGSSSSGIEFIGAVSVGVNNLTLYTTGPVTQSADITAAGLELLGTGGTYTLTNTSNAITTLAGNTGTISFLDDGGFSVGTVSRVGVTASGTVTLASAANISLANNITTTGAQTYNGNVVLAANTTLATTNSDVSFGGTLRGDTAGRTLTIAAGTGAVSFTGAVGTTYTLGATAITAATVTNSSTWIGNSTLGITGNAVVNGAISGITTLNISGNTSLGANVTSSSTQTYTGAVTITGSTVTATTTNSAVMFASTVNSAATAAKPLTVSAGSGAVTFTSVVGGATDGVLGALTVNSTATTTFSAAVTAASVTTDASGTTAINGGAITTSGAQTYNEAITLGAATTCQHQALLLAPPSPAAAMQLL